MDDAVPRYLAASAAGDVDGIMEALAPTAALVSPISGRMVFRGSGDLRVLLGAVFGTVQDLKWERTVVDGAACVAVGTMRVGPFKLTDAQVFDLDQEGRICRIRPHLRPWAGLTAFALTLGPKVARHPGVIRRALRA